MSFQQKRRQQFLGRAYYAAILKGLVEWDAELLANLSRADLGRENLSLESARLAGVRYDALSLRHTAGEPFESLRPELTGVVEAYERYQRALGAYEGEPDAAPLGLGRLDDYERCMQLIGLCYLLHRRDLLPRIAALEDPAYAGEDVLYEELLDYAVPGRFETVDLKFVEVYDPLIQAMYAESPEAATAAVASYVANWYPWFKLVPWHDGHLRIKGTDGDYFGYWAFEAGAVALLCDIDDASITHMVYPKDMVAWAREHAYLSEPDAQGHVALRCPATHPCPRSGFWFTPAAAGKRQRFVQGDVMPDLGGAYGATIWQWDEQQGEG